MILPTTISPVIAHYFQEGEGNNVLLAYVQLGLEALKNGEVCVQVEEEHRVGLKSSKHVSCSLDDLSKPFILTEDKLYFQRYLLYENQVYNKIKTLILSGRDKETERFEQLKKYKNKIEKLFGGFERDSHLSEIENTDWQRVAVINAFLKDFMVLTGGPGTGKTTTVSKLLSLLFTQDSTLKVSLIAQTGKASTRLKESLDNSRKSLNLSPEVESAFDRIAPSTIHRFLDYVKNSIDFRRNTVNPVESDVVILDESSMVDLPMMAKLLNAIPDGTRVYLLGDLNQLSSVEVGSVFGDLCLSLGKEVNRYSEKMANKIEEFYSEFKNIALPDKTVENILKDHVVKLERSYRFSSVKGLGKFAYGLLNASEITVDFLADYKKPIKEEGVRIVSNTDTEIEKEFIFKYQEYIMESDNLKALELMNKVKVLCAVKEGSRGVFETNSKIEQLLEGQNLLEPQSTAYHNQPILIQKNDYAVGLYNGDVGLIRQNKEGRLMAFFKSSDNSSETGLDSYEISSLPAFQTAFAMTIHKSQGSEFEDVVLALPEKEHKVLSKQLVYTGVTRAKKRVLIISSDEVFISAVNKVEQRLSNLKKRF